MDISKIVILKTLIPRIPGIIMTLILNKLGLSPCADKQDAKVEATVYIIKAFTSIKRPASIMQARSTRDPGVRGRIWLSKATTPAPDASVRDIIVKAIGILGNGTEDYIIPELRPVEGEWTGFRESAGKKSSRPDLSEKEHYDNLMKEVTSKVTILYFHGGGYLMMDPASTRGLVYNLAKNTGGKVFSVRYRLAPQHPFPAALLDALTTYLYLLSPPKGSFHEPIPASQIVFAGESAGGNLASVLCLLLVTLKRAGVNSIPFQGKDVPLELPAGIALNSPWCDIGRGLPSQWTNAKYDYLHPPVSPGVEAWVLPPDDIWPSDPPRAEMFCQASLLMHPLVSPVTATSDQWQGCPPVFICGGNETIEDEYTVMARNMHLAGTSVHFIGYEGMPHCFAMVVSATAQAKDCLKRWSQFCADAVSKSLKPTDQATWNKARSYPLKFYDVPMKNMGLTNDVVRQTLEFVRRLGMNREKKEIEEWRAKSSSSSASSASSSSSSKKIN